MQIWNSAEVLASIMIYFKKLKTELNTELPLLV